MTNSQRLALTVFTIALLAVGLWWAFSSNHDDSAVTSEEEISQSSKTEDETSSGAPELDSEESRETASSDDPNQPQSAKPQTAKPINPSPSEASLKNFFASKGKGQWKVRFNDKGEPFRVIGGKVPGVTRDLASVRSFVGELAPELGLPPEQLTEKIEHDSTPRIDIYDAVQTFGKDETSYDVFDAYLRVIGSKESHDGFIFNNTTKPVNRDEVVVPAPISLKEAEDILVKHYGDQLKRIKTRRGPVVWAGAEPHETAYQFQVTITDDDHLTLVGAQSKKVVYFRSERMH